MHIPLGGWLVLWALCLPGIAQENAGNPSAVDASAHAEVDASVHASLDEPVPAPPPAAPIMQSQPRSRWSAQPAKSSAPDEAFSSFRGPATLPMANSPRSWLPLQAGTPEIGSSQSNALEPNSPLRAAGVAGGIRDQGVTAGFAFRLRAQDRSTGGQFQPLRVLPGLPPQSDAGIGFGPWSSSLGDTAGFASPIAGMASQFTGNPSIFKHWYFAGAAAAPTHKNAARRHELHSDHDTGIFPRKSDLGAPGSLETIPRNN